MNFKMFVVASLVSIGMISQVQSASQSRQEQIEAVETTDLALALDPQMAQARALRRSWSWAGLAASAGLGIAAAVANSLVAEAYLAAQGDHAAYMQATTALVATAKWRAYQTKLAVGDGYATGRNVLLCLSGGLTGLSVTVLVLNW